MIRFASPKECHDGSNEWIALYFSRKNTLALTPHCTEGEIVPALIHELTHWAQTLGLTKREIKVESKVYAANLKKLGMDWMERSIIERHAAWVENECLSEVGGEI
jgi:hypothetical protein